MWSKIDDQFINHPKVIGLSDAAVRTWLAGLCYAGQYLTDGRLPRGFVAGHPDEAVELMDARLWDPLSAGEVQIHDYLDYNPPAAQVRAEREQKAAAKKRGGQQRAAAARRGANGQFRPAEQPAASQQTASPVPVPVPVPVPEDQHRAPRKRDAIEEAGLEVGQLEVRSRSPRRIASVERDDKARPGGRVQ